MLAKVCLVGPKGVGKSTIVENLEYQKAFTKFLKGTSVTNCKINIGNAKLDMQIWDIFCGGDDKWICMGPIFFKGIKAAICLFDITSRQSFLELKAWVISVLQNANDDAILVLVANKKDKLERAVSESEAIKYAESIGACFIETSAKSGEGIDNVFHYIGVSLVRQMDLFNSYHAKLAVSSSGMGFCGCKIERKNKKWKLEKNSLCFPCLLFG